MVYCIRTQACLSCQTLLVKSWNHSLALSKLFGNFGRSLTRSSCEVSTTIAPSQSLLLLVLALVQANADSSNEREVDVRRDCHKVL